MTDDELTTLYRSREQREIAQAATTSAATGLKQIAQGQAQLGLARIRRAMDYLPTDSTAQD